VLVDAQDRSVGTARTYAGRLALYLTWAAGRGVDEARPSVEELAAFARWLERTPSRKHRPGRNRRQAPVTSTLSLTPARSPATIDGILTAVVEFVRFLAGRGLTDVVVAERLSVRHELRFLPAGFAPPEHGGRPVVERRLVRRRKMTRPPMTLTAEQVGELVDACRNARDRFIVEALYATGVRVAELCGMHRSDLHFVPSAAHLGCRVDGPHLHVVRRPDNENGALAKSIYPRSVPVSRRLVWSYSAYCLERDDDPEAAESDYVLVNLYRAPLGRALSPGMVEELFVRLSDQVGFRARPHMLRHSFASEVAALTKDPALVKEFLGHASIYSVDVYLHTRWAEMRGAVDELARKRRP